MVMHLLFLQHGDPRRVLGLLIAAAPSLRPSCTPALPILLFLLSCDRVLSPASSTPRVWGAVCTWGATCTLAAITRLEGHGMAYVTEAKWRLPIISLFLAFFCSRVLFKITTLESVVQGRLERKRKHYCLTAGKLSLTNAHFSTTPC